MVQMVHALRFENNASKAVVHGDVNGDAKANFIIQLTGEIDLVKADFVL